MKLICTRLLVVLLTPSVDLHVFPTAVSLGLTVGLVQVLLGWTQYMAHVIFSFYRAIIPTRASPVSGEGLQA